jgi:pSer/pThr/pTyr-binding forkhead associated (FHA) protein
MGISHRPKKYSRKRGGRAPARVKSDKKEGFILTVVDGPQTGKEYFFEHSATIGRVETNDIILVEPGISRNHARFYDDQGIFLVEDLGSANGTRLNGEKVEEPEVLRDGDYITIAGTTLQFSQLTAAARGDVTAQTSLSRVEALAIDATSTDVDQEGPRGLKGFVRSRRGQVILVLLVVCIVGAGYYLKTRTTGQLIVVDQSTVPVAYSDEDEFFNAVFGYGNYDETHLNQVVFHFEYLGGRATLQYGAWGVNKVGELLVKLNGESLGKVPLTMNRWVYGLKINLPRDKLKKGANELVFDNVFNPPGRETWEVCYVVILQEAIPPPDAKEAQAQFNLAKKAWEDREIEPGNMYKALMMFKRARNLLEALPEKPELYQDAVDYIERVDKALTRRFSEGLFSARRAEKFDADLSKARTILLQTRPYFHKDDFRYREIQRYLEALAAQ